MSWDYFGVILISNLMEEFMATNYQSFNDRLEGGNKTVPPVEHLLHSFGIRINGVTYDRDEARLFPNFDARFDHDLIANGHKIEIKGVSQTYEEMLRFNRTLASKKRTADLEHRGTLASVVVPSDAYHNGLIDMGKLFVVSHKSEFKPLWKPQLDNRDNDPCWNYYTPKLKQGKQYVNGGNGVYWGYDATLILINYLVDKPHKIEPQSPEERFKIRMPELNDDGSPKDDPSYEKEEVLHTGLTVAETRKQIKYREKKREEDKVQERAEKNYWVGRFESAIEGIGQFEFIQRPYAPDGSYPACGGYYVMFPDCEVMHFNKQGCECDCDITG